MRKRTKNLSAGVVSALLMGSPAVNAGPDATYPFIDLLADAGSYTNPVSLGNGVQLNGCGTTIHAAQGTPTFGLCESGMDHTEFTLTWKASLNPYADGWNPGNADWTTIQSFSGADVLAGATMLAATGAGTAFATAGTYVVGLWVEMTSSEYWQGQDVSVTLPGGLVRYPGGDSWLTNLGDTNYSFSLSSVTINPAAVPEPASALLLVGGLAFMARRERKRRQKVQTCK